MIRYVLKQITPEGLWTSPEVFEATERRHIAQAVTAGFLAGQPRWAEDEAGEFITGVDSKGRDLRTSPEVSRTVTTVDAWGHTRVLGGHGGDHGDS